ncbi:hypothetical protein PQU95_02600 [Vogesella sp. DC21W]|uniref:Uncharacterized protein n=1 Tax=Vogesella aquatica TaxID=2984206 RepID=A0ABT5IUB9_9NEIS|nr:hypothetical protein [Vogesella aquatica]MDC7716113.1 hypothetical protein [Vogesella aquatica]
MDMDYIKIKNTLTIMELYSMNTYLLLDENREKKYGVVMTNSFFFDEEFFYDCAEFAKLLEENGLIEYFSSYDDFFQNSKYSNHLKADKAAIVIVENSDYIIERSFEFSDFYREFNLAFYNAKCIEEIIKNQMKNELLELRRIKKYEVDF